MHARIPRPLFRSLLAGSSALALVLALGPTADASTGSSAGHGYAVTAAQARAALAGQAAAAARTALRHLSVGQHATNQPVAQRAYLSGGTTQVSSTNWSGYADNNTSGNTYSSLTGNWTQPSVSCSGFTEQLAAFWVGIDGYSSDSVEQDGTLAECYFGFVFYYTWWEMYPSNDIQVVGESVAAGDSISASVVRSGDSYTLKVTDSTHSSNSFSTTQTCSDCANSSAEWIAEAPSSSTGVEPLADFHTWTASGATVSSGSTAGVISTFPNDEITMVGSSDVKAQPGPLNSSGNGFSVTWEHSS
jgi:hypothetical protein